MEQRIIVHDSKCQVSTEGVIPTLLAQIVHEFCYPAIFMPSLGSIRET